jgi:acyl transferase domain-containing protein/NADPH:quinone reductase-like Zn-dependent oxidoreductase/NAD(P)-dependent dehydrogenase (short-subunit alcohol dehydrogenase family)/acyl carrier protein
MASGWESLLHVAQALAELRDPPRLWVVSRGLQPVGGTPGLAALAQAPTWGLARTIAAEHPELRCTSVDLDGQRGDDDAAALWTELEAGLHEDQVAYRQKRRHVARLVRRPTAAATDGQPVELEIATRGILDELRLQPSTRRSPGPGEVEIRVAAAGMNFRDVLNAMGVYEGPAGPMGSECAGTVVAVGQGVESVAVGQDVMTMANGTFRTYVTTPAALVVPKPRTLSFAEAAAIPVAYMTAEFALNRLGKMKAGERVLIHAATGGVGLAAVQLAQRAGVEVFATAGSDEKRDYLRSLGVVHIMDSRSVAFAEEVMKRTGGEGIDLVLNSLTGEAIPKSLGLLRAGGRFLEIGKAGIWTEERMSAARPDVSYFPIYLGQADPAVLRSMLVALGEAFDSGALDLEPVRAFPMAQASSAFRFMAQAKHIGKLVLTEEAGAPGVRADATYLITGGLGSLGLLLAGWMVERGARRLVLVGRREPTDAARDTLAKLRETGAEIVIAQGDVSDDAFVARLVAEAGQDARPLRGVIHAAGVLDDGVVAQLTSERFERVLAPKASGAWNLHRATLGIPLDFFVLFSSAASLLGSPGQGNYAAANTFLDSLAHYRRGEGLPAVSIDWGPWGDVGMAASLDARDQARIMRQGLRLISPAEGLAAFERLLAQPSPQVGVLPFDIAKLLAAFPPGGEPPFLAELAQGRVREKAVRAPSARPELIAQIEQAPVARRRGLVLAHVQAQVLGVLGLPPASAPDPQQGLRDLGMDSLMAIELRNRLQRGVGATLPPTVAFDFPTIAALTDYLLENVQALAPGRAESEPAAALAVTPATEALPGADDPIAIIGVACRFPGQADTPEAFWSLLQGGVDTIREVPPDRWDIDDYYDPDPDAPGKMYIRHGGFVDNVQQFDSTFFGISPREAVSMDPQHRLLLEVSWEALERAGQAPEKLMGSRTGVFVGISSNDYSLLHLKAQDATRINAYYGTGNSGSTAAGRLSYVLGLRGPCLAVDTACSSSLVAIHLACQSLRSGECRTALTAGVNLILTPEVTINFCRARMLATDGRCKTFDAAADGYVRGEGCGAVVLKRLRDAVADGDPILALIRGSAVNQDGRSAGLTVPNGPAQEALLREALATAGVLPSEVGYVEAHGTGTSLGDPIEMAALGSVLREGRSPDRPLVVGSVKTNVGHLEAAAGVAGLIKVVLSLQHQEIPPHLHFKQLNPHISIAEIPAVIPTSATPWPEASGRRIAGISSFGFAGTNAHIVVEGAPAALAAPAISGERTRHIVALSAKTEPALQALAGRLAQRLAAEPALSPADMAFSMNTGRGTFPHRLAAVVESTAQAAALLADVAEGGAPAAAIRGEFRGSDRAGLAFLFTGQGSQYPGMGRQLYETQPTFRRVLDRCDEILRPLLPRPLLSAMYPKDGEATPLDRTEYTQPALFALEYSLFELWRSFGIEPSAVMGHSVGEYVAACVAGVFSLEDGLRLIAARGRLMGALPSGGAMAAVLAEEDRVRRAIAGHGPALSVAAVNGPASVVISGLEAAVQEVIEGFDREGVRTKRLTVSHAFHSALMEPALDEFERLAGEVSFAAPRLTLIANVTGRAAGEDVCTAAYWRQHAREAVRFADGMSALWQLGYRTFVEAGPSPTLLGMGRQCVPSEEDASWLGSLVKNRDSWAELAKSLGTLYVRGYDVDWAGFDQDYARRKVVLPTYPFERQRHWIETGRPRPEGSQAADVHPLLGHRLSSASKDVLFDARIDAEALPYLADHCVYGNVVVPAAAYLEMGLAAAAQTLGSGPHVVENVVVSEPMVLVSGSERPVQVIVTPQEGEPSRFQVFSRTGGGDSEPERWHVHAAGTLRDASDADPSTGASETLAAIRERCSATVGVAGYYDALRESGIDYGPRFQAMAELWSGKGEALGRLALPAAVEGDDAAYVLHPVLLDAGFQVLGAADLGDKRDAEHVYLPIGLDRLRGVGRRPVWAHARTRSEAGAETLTADIRFFDDAGEVVALVEGLHLRRASRQSLRRAQQGDGREWLYEVAWSPEEGALAGAVEAGPSGRWVVFTDRGGVGASLGRSLAARGDTCVLVRPGDGHQQSGDGIIRVDPEQPEDFKRLYRELLNGGEMPVRGVLHLWSLDEEGPLTGSSLKDAMRTSCGSLLHLVQAMASVQGAAAPRLWVVTRGAQAVGRAPVAPAQAAAGGLARTIATEHPELGCVSVDLDPVTAEAEEHAAVLWAEMASRDREDRVAYRGGKRHRARLVRCAATPSETAGGAPAAGQPVALEVGVPGILDELRLRPATRRAPAPGEVEIRVLGSGLNFRDVLNALGVYEGPAGPLGCECAGRVVAVGEGVRGLEVGQRVVAMAADTFRTYVTIPAVLVAPFPEGMTFGEAATIPITFLTAEYALNRLGKMKAGERVLIHAGAGGVGLAAVQLAQRAGAEVFATAGSDEKRDYLKSLGVAHVFDSRSLSFAEGVMKATGGEGVDLVLNSLTGEFIPKSLGVLRRGGRFLEIGKAGIWSPEQMSAARKDVSYFVIYLGEVEPGLIQQMLTDLMRDFGAGHLKPLRRREYALEAAPDAFRHMAQAKHIGKVVLMHHETGMEGVAPRRGSTYLVTGGLGSLGLRIARWLQEQGARHIVLVGRRQPSDEARKVIADCVAAGAEVRVECADVTRAEDVDRVMAMVAVEMPPLRGIVHAAGVLDDGVLSQQTWPRFETVLGPKVMGGFNLHRATEATPLDFFVMFASTAGVLGSAGQGAYGAANAFLDTLAHHRRAEGRSALSIDWGPWADTGMAAALAQSDQRRWAEVGLTPIPPSEGLAMLERLLPSGRAQVTVLPVRWPRFLAQFGGTEPRLFADVAREVRPGAAGRSAVAESAALRKRLDETPPNKRRRVVLAHVREQVLKVLALDASHPLDDRQGFQALGMDSLMAVELRNRLQAATGRTLSSTLAFDYPTVEAISAYLSSEVFGLAPEVDEEAQRAAAEEAERDREQRSQVLAELGSLSEDEAEALLLQELDANRKVISK